ncbi:amino acid adenylation domain-containing protein, partial [Streptomyces hyaluromycini]
MNRAELVDVLPLSPMQEGMLFHALYDTAGPDVYAVQQLFDLTGPLDAGRLRRAAGALLTRHPSLRACFPQVTDGQPVQAIPAEVDVPWTEVDLSGLPEDAARAELARVQAEDHARRFDPAEPPLLRFTLVRLAADRHCLVLASHHILLDGWSTPIVARDLFALYGNGGDTAALPRVTPFREHLAWLARQDRDAARDAWRRELAGTDQPTLLAPADPTRVPRLPERLVTEAPEELTAALGARAQELGVTVNTLLQAAWGLVLSRTVGQRDVVFGSIVSGRTSSLPDVESMVGLFINIVPVRVRVAPGRTLGELAADLQKAQSALTPHHHLGLSDIQQALGMPELFDTMMVFENYPFDGPDHDVAAGLGTGLHVLPALERGRDATHYPLTLVVAPGKRLYLRLDYRDDLFDEATAQALLDRLQRVLAALAADPTVPVGRIDLLAPVERRLVLDAWNDTVRVGEPALLPDRFAAQVAAVPDAPAACFEDGLTLSYAELDRRSSRLARTLIGRGIGPESIVALALDRSPEHVVAIMAVVKAGAAHLPLDPSHPQARIRFMLEDARPAILLTSHHTMGAVPAGDATPLLVLDDPDTAALLDAQQDTAPTAADRPRPLSLHSPAYVIYTSGSTGRPKAVQMTGLGVANMLRWHHDQLGGGPGTRTAQFTAISFDVSVQEILSALLHGKTLVVPTEDTRRDPHRFAAWLARHEVNELFAPTTVLEAVAEAAVESALELPCLTHVAQAGEALTLGPHLRLLHEQVPGRHLHNHYGPTEAQVLTAHTLPTSPTTWPPAAPLGHPIDNVRTYLLDHTLHPVPPNTPGELYTNTPGLARGYLHRPALTAERFTADPYGPPGTRMYRTGDLARHRPDGTLEYLGRTDDQLKIRGFRIEPGEIETTLTTHPHITQATVLIRQDRPGDHRLTAYTVPATGRTPNPHELRTYLRDRLPEYMVPTTVVVLPALPQTANGKLDRTQLPAPAHTPTPDPHQARTPQEQILCDLFAHTLGLPHTTTTTDNFFDLGGHSLLATRLTARIRTTFDTEIDVRTIFEAPTPAAIATHLQNGGPARTTLTTRKRPKNLPLSFAQRRLWFIHQLEGPSPTYNIPLALHFTGTLNPDALQAALTDVVTRHESLRTVFTETHGTATQHVLTPHEVEIAFLTTPTTDEELPDRLLAAAREPFDLGSQPPIRAHLFTHGPDTCTLLLTLHHIAGDGWSLSPLAADLTRAYTARCGGAEPDWAPLPVQYADYTLWQNDLLEQSAAGADDTLLSRQLAYWTAQLADLPDELALPANRPRPDVASYRGDYVTVAWDAELHRALDRLARRCGATLFMVLQAGLAALLSRLGAGHDIPVGSPIAGRTDQATDHLIGFFVNTLVLRTDTSGDPTFEELVGRVRETALSAYAHQDIPFEYLVEVLNPQRSLGRHPLFQVMLALQNAPRGRFDLPGLDVSVGQARTGTAKFDLFFSMAEHRDEAGAPAGVEGAVEFASDLYDAETVRGLFHRWTLLLGEAAADPSQRLGQIDVLAAAERRALLHDRNATRREGEQVPFTALFARQAEADPERPAVLADDAELTYGELHERSDRLARVLAGRGAAPGRLVAVA